MRSFLTGEITQAVLKALEKSKLGKSRRKLNGKVKSIELPDMFLVIGIIFFVFCVAFAVGSFLSGEKRVSLFFLIFSLLGVWLAILWKNKRIFYSEEEIIRKNFRGKKKRFSFSDFVGYTGIVGKTDIKYITADGHKLAIDRRAAEAAEIHKLIKTKYEELHNEQLPKLEPKKDIFNNNLRNPDEYICIFAILLLAPIVLGCLLLLLGEGPINESNCESISVTVEKYEIDENDLHFYSHGCEDFFVVYDYEKYVSDIESFEGLYKSDNSFEVWCQYREGDIFSYAHYDVMSIVYNEKELLSFESTNKLQEKQNLLMIVIFAIAFFLIFVVALIHIIIARHPEKFNPKLVRLFFKEGSFVKYNYGRD